MDPNNPVGIEFWKLPDFWLGMVILVYIVLGTIWLYMGKTQD